MEAGLCRRALEIGGLLYRGAEAEVYEARWFCMPAVVKVRPPKPYRHARIDELLRTRRTVAEARAMYAALRAGVNVPAVYLVDPVEKMIVMERLEGVSLAALVESNTPRALEAARQLGSYAARLHAAGVAHGDLTTSNVVVVGGEVFLVDFGLASLDADEDDYAVDVHLFMRSLESTHPDHVEDMLQSFLEGYRQVAGRDAVENLMKRVEEIRLMGRYREERRRSVWGQVEQP